MHLYIVFFQNSIKVRVSMHHLLLLFGIYYHLISRIKQHALSNAFIYIKNNNEEWNLENAFLNNKDYTICRYSTRQPNNRIWINIYITTDYNFYNYFEIYNYFWNNFYKIIINAYVRYHNASHEIRFSFWSFKKFYLLSQNLEPNYIILIWTSNLKHFTYV